MILPCFWRGGGAVRGGGGFVERESFQGDLGAASPKAVVGCLEGDLGYCVIKETFPHIPG